MQTWLPIEEFSKLVGKELTDVEKMCQENKLVHKRDAQGRLLIEAASGTVTIIPRMSLVSEENGSQIVGAGFVEKTIGTILALHEKVLDAKDETLEALRNENKFLKEGLLSMQELYEEERRVVESLTQQLDYTRQELEFMKRKYKLMWEKAVDNHTKGD